jgi:hypothetical protein
MVSDAITIINKIVKERKIFFPTTSLTFISVLIVSDHFHVLVAVIYAVLQFGINTIIIYKAHRGVVSTVLFSRLLLLMTLVPI